MRGSNDFTKERHVTVFVPIASGECLQSMVWKGQGYRWGKEEALQVSISPFYVGLRINHFGKGK